ncbi:hypothetical protein PRIPAC_74124 [Pristionchus pacificus]|uniref:Uncharacterized protein n=1 Tax=Pristionchus pacificus TaxID=54126 RepID=A0A2A6BGF5_PRIPA|nr:hypothetical protein PRIPAC_74124 [Pristionchus pacificus]|eukprot:PDM64970.1 hypothetical protein PRIPAC_53226 [Pristionchus pacificus]
MSSISSSIFCLLISLLAVLAQTDQDAVGIYETPMERLSSRPIVQFKRGEAIRLCIMRQNCFNQEKLRKYFNIVADIRNPVRK